MVGDDRRGRDGQKEARKESKGSRTSAAAVCGKCARYREILQRSGDFCTIIGPKEVISDGENGFLVKPGDTEDFAEKMELLMNDEALRKRMGAQAAKTVMRFHKESILDQWEALLGV